MKICSGSDTFLLPFFPPQGDRVHKMREFLSPLPCGGSGSSVLHLLSTNFTRGFDIAVDVS